MSIEAKELSRNFGSQKAVDSLSFSLRKGEIVGFLGPNGAGKSTTMKMLSGYLPPSEGTALLGGLDLRSGREQIKRITGYLPEHNPLYPEMYVREFLLFTAGLHRMNGRKKRVEEMIALCGIAPEAHKKISQLSKGYRQRLGLAAALIHDPDILILDEPVSGLDPNQRIEVRKLIRKLGTEKTVLFSSHILQEVEAVCERVIVIDRGRIVADDKLSALKARMKGGDRVVLGLQQQVKAEDLERLPGVVACHPLGPSRYEITAKSGLDIRAGLFEAAVRNHWVIIEMRLAEEGTEDLFARLTRNRKEDVESV